MAVTNILPEFFKLFDVVILYCILATSQEIVLSFLRIYIQIQNIVLWKMGSREVCIKPAVLMLLFIQHTAPY